MRLINADSIPWDVEGVGTIPVVTKDEIDKMPAVDAVPVRHGMWLDYLKEGLKYKCSECESRFDRPYKYCPNCGATMNGQEDTGKNL